MAQTPELLRWTGDVNEVPVGLIIREINYPGMVPERGWWAGSKEWFLKKSSVKKTPLNKAKWKKPSQQKSFQLLQQHDKFQMVNQNPFLNFFFGPTTGGLCARYESVWGCECFHVRWQGGANYTCHLIGWFWDSPVLKAQLTHEEGLLSTPSTWSL